MAADDLSAPLGQTQEAARVVSRSRSRRPSRARWACSSAIFVLWAALADNPFGGEPMVVVPADLQAPANAPAKKAEAVRPPRDRRRQHPRPLRRPCTIAGLRAARPAAGSKTVTIIDGKSGSSQEVVIAGPADGKDAAASLTPIDQKFVETTHARSDPEDRRRRRASRGRLRAGRKAHPRQARRATRRDHRRRARRQRQRHHRSHRASCRAR